MFKPKPISAPWNKKKPVLRPMEDRKRVAFYHTSRWTKESRSFRRLHPFCIECEKEGIVEAAEVTDHIIPLEICEDPWSWANWQGLCRRHNNIKAAQDKKLIEQHRKESK